MMRHWEVKERMIEGLRLRSGLEQHRPYLGMSGINKCPLRLYTEFLNGRGFQSDKAHWFCKLGYTYEALAIDLLGVEPVNLEVVAGWDERFRGHIDNELEGNLVEIKSVSWQDWLRVSTGGKPDQPHFEQVQLYMRYGDYPLCHLIYLPRDVPPGQWQGFPVWVFDVWPKANVVEVLEGKARRILWAIDRQEPCMCECGRC